MRTYISIGFEGCTVLTLQRVMWGWNADIQHSDGPAEYMSEIVSLFAAGSLASMNLYNPRINVDHGQMTKIGVKLAVKWPYGWRPAPPRPPDPG